ncbi:MAG: helix-turn-helix domain-containing protein [Candidatus Methanomethylophilaceae archaeon]|jgi:DNA-binding HxlR family transcriptional regulator|nr:helix-turn-helix domain-containing protein [Candidatus Methanomethylophilaceae archaeon]NCA73412.1 transcriptional regulator [Gammaproteobacteria bacterium]MDD3351063.1 helix-turn-helix domain-containing protein [Candidatus Methanomethylophilaceae archaeon]MDD3986335.1 helix-turn-helix domain-containing protein [Candidatus Methanomethylophilaceae archaeon]MDD4708862.1 helix-turn-helix domain-containing protein [Candidatus Methanomethylophilaceae archaeon]
MNDNCTVYRTMGFLSKKWTLLIILELYRGGDTWKRFSEIKRSMKDITPKILSERLRNLEEEGVIERRVDTATVPIRSEYRLTEMGRELTEVAKGIKTWALKWKINNPVCASQDCIVCVL